MEKDETILKLYENLANEIYQMTFEKLEICRKISEQEDLIIPTLSDEQKEIFDKLNQLKSEKNELVNKNTFVYAYKLATKLIIESILENNKKAEKNSKEK